MAAEATHGTLGLSSPWARSAIRPPLAAELEALVPVGWTIGVSFDAHRGYARAWANSPDGGLAVHRAEARSAEQAVRSVIGWILREGVAA